MRGNHAYSFVELLLAMTVLACLTLMALEVHRPHGRRCRIVHEAREERRRASARLLWSFDNGGRPCPDDALLTGQYLIRGREPRRKEIR